MKRLFDDKIKDTRSRAYIPVKKVLWQEAAENTDELLKQGDGHASLSPQGCCLLKKGGGILLEFGIELVGGVEIVFHRAGSGMNTKIRVRFGESAMEAMSDIGFKNATNDHAMRDFEVTVNALGSAEFGNTGFRFLRIDAVEDWLEIKDINAVAVYRDIKYKGSFESSDPLLNRIWEVGAYTVHLNMQDYLLDGIKRDRLVWIGDMHPETSTIQAVFGYDECVPKSLDLIKRLTSPTAWMNGIPTYSLWWIKIHRDWYFQNGDIAYLKAQEAYLCELLEYIFSFISADGSNTIENKFIDWASYEDNTAREIGLHALLIIAISAAQEICSELGNTDMANNCKQKLDLLYGYKPAQSSYKQAEALYALANPELAKQINENSLAVNPLDGLSTFLGYYTLQARALAGDIDGAFEAIKGYWGKMLELGATTFWEDFDLAWAEGCANIDEIITDGRSDIHGDFGRHCYKGYRHSLCHGWASGPTAFLSRYVLGIEILEAGCRKIKITPMLGKLDYVRGSYPTPYGIIEVEHKRSGEEIITTVKVPEDITIE